jgi:hypothetical protein
MSEKWKLIQSRNKWRQKAIERGKNARAYRKEIRRIKSERDRATQEADTMRAELKFQHSQIDGNRLTKTELIYLVLSLFLVARIGFRAISRVLTVLKDQLGLTRAPCAQTISNWVIRLSIAKTQLAPIEQCNEIIQPATQKSVWLMDLSIGLGAGKILSILALNLKHHQQHNNAPTLQDVACIAVSVAASWSGEAIADFLKTVMAQVGESPSAFLKDGGTDLEKAISILNEQGASFISIADVSHVIANLFKHYYGEHDLFNTFITACGQVSKNLKQTLLASLAPPKISIKARFMNLHRLVAWADQLLKHSSRGAAKAGSVLFKLRNSLDQLPACKAFIQRFLRDAVPLLECQKILKKNGLNTNTYQMCEKLVAVIPASSPIRNGFINWAKQQLNIAATLKVKSSGLPISTDVLESLFGVGKKLGTGQIKDADRIASRLPAFCGGLSLADAEKVMTISVKQQQALMGNRQSLIQQRRAVLPKPERLETLAYPASNQNVQLIRKVVVPAEKIDIDAVRIPEPVEEYFSRSYFDETPPSLDFCQVSAGAIIRNGASLEIATM